MPRLLSILFLLSLLFSSNKSFAKSDHGEQEEFLNRCPPKRCGGGGSGSPEIRYPLRLDSSPPSCGASDLVLSCSGGRAFLSLPTLHLPVVAINYPFANLVVKLEDPSWARCPLKNLSSLWIGSSQYSPTDVSKFSLVSCSTRIPESSVRSDGNFVGPISCLGGPADFAYAVDAYLYMDVVPSDCAAISNDGYIPYVYWDNNNSQNIDSMASMIDDFSRRRELTLTWQWRDGMRLEVADYCADCELGGGTCLFSQSRNQSFCYKPANHGSNVKLIIGTSVGGVSIFALLYIIFFYIYKKSDNEEETRLRIETFLTTYQNTKPTRYSYSEVKKITKRFNQKLGQGGFGSVYKGELPNGIPVAVKMIETSRTEGEEFINEVATIGRIHHVNVVRLLGFCSEGTRRALIYEFMPNESLEKFIFSLECQSIRQQLSMRKLQEIAVGIAQGIEYLHQGCDQRILHFDIKPHNILLDHNFMPKISDFGLAKLCSRDQSMITMTAARGTMGYIAPEIYSRNFGHVSYKSDVYSFGMLLLEMVSGRKNVDPSVDDQSAVYFPEWVYDRLVHGEDLGLVAERNQNDELIAKKLLIVALWCIQWSPMDRPTMSRVVQMLLGEFHGLEMPPKPFVSTNS
ncbi:putative receptor-like protein kinase [Apostasia shenzhenica]|uniref:Putative receptor-like protein kinase n=1 Tax=Apostasia shenzhenica TaxID=1088818 RepID=A0A2I0A148_9ASPA|nr:putative receptor-like protein kinase [Apostasia shenzhenica]